MSGVKQMAAELMFNKKPRFDSRTPPMKLQFSNSSFSLWFEMPYASKNRERSKKADTTLKVGPTGGLKV